MNTPPASPVEFRRSPGNGGPFEVTPLPIDRATTARDWPATFQDTALRQRSHAVALILVGVIAVSSGLLVAELGYAAVGLGAGVGVYGLYLWLR